MTDPSPPRMTSPAALRNREPIADVLARVLPASAAEPVLEIASGTGEHVVYFAARFPWLAWQPSDPRPEARASVDALVADAGLANVRAALALDVLVRPWPVARACAVVCINMIHASPVETVPALLEGVAGLLAPGAPLFLYGAYRVGGAHTAPSNESFDGWLKARDPRWGVRDVEWVEEEAARAALDVVERVAMPANNLALVLRRRAAPGTTSALPSRG